MERNIYRITDRDVEFTYQNQGCVLQLETGWLSIDSTLIFPVLPWILYIFREKAGWSDPSGKTWMLEAEEVQKVEETPSPDNEA